MQRIVVSFEIRIACRVNAAKPWYVIRVRRRLATIRCRQITSTAIWTHRIDLA